MTTKRKFKMLSVNYTNQCIKNPRCSFCYLKKQELLDRLLDKPAFHQNYWDVPLKLLRDTEQIAIAYNGLGIMALKLWLTEAQNCKTIANITTNPKFLTPPVIALFKREKVKMVALSLDPEKCRVDFWIRKAKELRRKGLKVGANILMLDEVFKNIAKVLVRIFPFSDQIHLLRPKFYTTKIPLEDRRDLIFLLKQQHKNLFIDECFRWEFTGEPCGRGKDFLSINADGSTSLCSFDLAREGIKNLKKCPYI